MYFAKGTDGQMADYECLLKGFLTMASVHVTVISTVIDNNVHDSIRSCFHSYKKTEKILSYHINFNVNCGYKDILISVEILRSI